MNEIHIWELPANKIYVLLEESFRFKLLNFCLNLIKRIRANENGRSSDKLATWLNEKSKKYKLVRCKISGRDIYSWRKGEEWIAHNRRKIKKAEKLPVFIPLWCLKELCNFAVKYNPEFSLENAEKHIFAYRAKSGIPIYPTYENEHKLPVKATPILTSILFHMLGDGCETSTTPYYTQENPIGLESVKKKFYTVFGYFEGRVDKKNFSFPLPIVYFVKKYFNIRSFGWNKGKVPKKVFVLDRMHKVSGLFSFILDEGSIGDYIKIHSGNKKLLKGIRELAISLGYECKNIKRSKAVFYFEISKKKSNLTLLIKDLLVLIKSYPLLDLAHKQIKIDILNSLLKKSGYPFRIKYNEKFLEKAIIETLTTECAKLSPEYIQKELPRKFGLTTSEIQNILWKKYNYPVTLQKLRNFLKMQAKNGLVKNLFFHNRIYVWGLPHHLSIKNPDKQIFQLLKNKPLTIKEISEKLNLPFDFVEYRIRKVLAGKNLLRKVGKKISQDKWKRTTRTILWGI